MSDLKTKITIELFDKATAGLKALNSALSKFPSLQKKLSESANKGTKALKDTTKALKEEIRYSKESFFTKKQQKNGFDELTGSIVKLGAALGVAHKLKEIVNVGREFELSDINLSVVLGTDLASKQLEKFKKNFEQLSQTGLATYQELMSTGYQLLSAGIKPEEALKGTRVALEVAKVTKGNAEEVANMMATASKDFRVDLERVGDIFTKTQIKFQIKDFMQFEEGMRYVAASAASLNIPLEQTATILGKLNDTGQVGSMAGTHFNEILVQMTKASRMLNIKIPRMQDGSMDLIGWMQSVSKAVEARVGKNKDLQFKAFQELFGVQGATAFMALRNRMGELKEDLKDVEGSSKGIVRKEIPKFYKSLDFQLKAINNTMTNLYNAIATAVIPSLKELLQTITPYIKEAISWINTHKELTKELFYAAAGFAALAAAAGGLWIISAILSPFKMMTGIALALIKPLALLTSGFIRLGIAMLFNPVGLVIAGVAAIIGLAYLLIKHWDKVKDFFKNFWQDLKEGFSKAISWVKDFISPVTSFIDKVKNFFGGKNKLETNVNQTVDTKLKPIASTANNTNSSKNINITHNNVIHINGSSLNPQEITDQILNNINNLNNFSLQGH